MLSAESEFRKSGEIYMSPRGCIKAASFTTTLPVEIIQPDKQIYLLPHEKFLRLDFTPFHFEKPLENPSIQTIKSIFTIAIPDYLHFLNYLDSHPYMEDISYVFGQTNASVANLAGRKLGFETADRALNGNLYKKEFKEKDYGDDDRYLLFAHKRTLIEKLAALRDRYSKIPFSFATIGITYDKNR